jgi:hypothetical protein
MPWQRIPLQGRGFEKRDMRQCSRSRLAWRRFGTCPRAVQAGLDAANLRIARAFPVLAKKRAHARSRNRTKERPMIARKIALVACAAALTTSPAWAHGSDDHPTAPARSHRCMPHKVGYVAAGTLRSQTLAVDVATADDSTSKPTYSGDVTIDVTKANHAAKGDKGTTKTYTLDHARVVFGLDDQNADGRVDLADVAAGDRAKVIGKVTKLAKRCDQTGFTPELTIKKLIVHAPAQPTS